MNAGQYDGLSTTVISQYKKNGISNSPRTRSSLCCVWVNNMVAPASACRLLRPCACTYASCCCDINASGDHHCASVLLPSHVAGLWLARRAMLGDWCGLVRDPGRAGGACDQSVRYDLQAVESRVHHLCVHATSAVGAGRLSCVSPNHLHGRTPPTVPPVPVCPMNAPPFPCRIPWSWWSAENRRSGEIEKKIGRSLVRVRSAGRTNNGRDRHAPRTLGYCVCIRVATGQLPLAVLARWSGY